MSRYQRVRVVGKGSFGCCWLVESESGDQCILKEIDVSKMPLKQKEEAANEVKVLSKLRHPFIINYRESYMSAGRLCIVTDFAEKGDLYKVIHRQLRCGQLLAEAHVLRWFTQTSLALKHLHDRHILHRDLKTQNIFLSGPGCGMVKLGDFGIARVLQHTQDCAHTAIGTPYYLSPEICQEKPYDRKSDIWSLGCVLYELATLQHAFDADSMRGLVMKILKGMPPQLPSSYSAALRALVPEMLTKDPRLRPSIDEVLRRPVMRGMIRQLLQEVEASVQSRQGKGGQAELHRPAEPKGHARREPSICGQEVKGRTRRKSDGEQATQQRAGRDPPPSLGTPPAGHSPQQQQHQQRSPHSPADSRVGAAPDQGSPLASTGQLQQQQQQQQQQQRAGSRGPEGWPPPLPEQNSRQAATPEQPVACDASQASVASAQRSPSRTQEHERRGHMKPPLLQRTREPVREPAVRVAAPSLEHDGAPVEQGHPQQHRRLPAADSGTSGPVLPCGLRDVAARLDRPPVLQELGGGSAEAVGDLSRHPVAPAGADHGSRSADRSNEDLELLSTLREGLHLQSFVQVKEEPEGMPSPRGTSQLLQFRNPDGEALALPVGELDTLSYRVEALKVYLEQEIGLDEFLYMYRFLNEAAHGDAAQQPASAADAQSGRQLESQVSSKAIRYLPLVHQLIVCEDKCFGN